MSQKMAFPLPDTETGPVAPLWQAASRREFRLPQCRNCKTFNWYPKDECRQCGTRDFDWVQLSGRATLFSWAIVRRALHKPLAPLAPYVSAIVVIDEDHATRFVTRLVDCDPARLHAGMPLEVMFADLGYPAIATGVIAPLFTTMQNGQDEE